jgi:hypothetical protein
MQLQYERQPIHACASGELSRTGHSYVYLGRYSAGGANEANDHRRELASRLGSSKKAFRLPGTAAVANLRAIILNCQFPFGDIGMIATMGTSSICANVITESVH